MITPLVAQGIVNEFALTLSLLWLSLSFFFRNDLLSSPRCSFMLVVNVFVLVVVVLVVFVVNVQVLVVFIVLLLLVLAAHVVCRHVLSLQSRHYAADCFSVHFAIATQNDQCRCRCKYHSLVLIVFVVV